MSTMLSNCFKRVECMALLLLLLSCAVAAYFLAGLYHFTMDDSFISFRYAYHLATGQGLVFNVNEFPRSEGITSPLYAAFLAIFVQLGFNLEITAKIIGVMMVFAVGYMLFRLFYLLFNDVFEKWLKALGALFLLFSYVTNAFVLANAISAMETLMGVAAITLFVYVSAKVVLDGAAGKQVSWAQSLRLALMALAIPLLRPELALFVGIFFICALLLFRSTKGQFSRALILFMLFGGIYFVWRMQYFSNLLPLPFYIKQAGSALMGLGDGKLFVKAYLLFIVFVLVVPFFTWRLTQLKERFLLLLGIAVTVQFVYYLTIQHIMGFGFRYFQPIVPFLLLFSVAGFTYFVDYFWRERRAVILMMFALFVVVVSVWNIEGVKRVKSGYIDRMALGIKNTKIVASAWKASANDVVIAMNDCGAFPYMTRFKIIDLAGLNNRNIALLNSVQRKRQEIIANNPDAIFLVAKNKQDLYGFEGLRIEDVTTLGYVHQGSMQILDDYYWMLFTQESKKMQKVAHSLRQQGLL